MSESGQYHTKEHQLTSLQNFTELCNTTAGSNRNDTNYGFVAAFCKSIN